MIAATGSDILPSIMSQVRKQLPANSYSAPVGATEFFVVLPGYRRDAATQWAGTVLTSDAIREQCGDSAEVRCEACELLPLETAEQLLVRAQEQLLAKTLVAL